VDEKGFNHLTGGYESIYDSYNGHISSFEAATNSLQVFTMTVTIARPRSLVQMEQSDMCLALNLAKMAKGEFSRTSVEDTLYVIKKPHANVPK